MGISTLAANALPILLITATAQAQYGPEDNRDDETLRIDIPPLFQTQVEQFINQRVAGSIFLDAIQPGCKFETFPAGFGFEESLKVEPAI
ncbi:uncharacterized protein Z519_11390 [Cladophialophora bantiana CBS 173.52]|uniref:Uncharacterized protein n=1 Tax=Cladophialophora bantiana (strain ATCC 10958 / CBS 173.52 / CDC B-1940 / NIH 8579) TaxID=1442370 RepID=A0A0D2ECE7_CLAB1|nr:uncharacterized protein Z519_11390 [Cladophialophora bantiana CBS 173.52]KIW87806.1 hypothetical protein Z519_11390 [Cladophialophora bantiana CBS 173.52]